MERALMFWDELGGFGSGTTFSDFNIQNKK